MQLPQLYKIEFYLDKKKLLHFSEENVKKKQKNVKAHIFAFLSLRKKNIYDSQCCNHI